MRLPLPPPRRHSRQHDDTTITEVGLLSGGPSAPCPDRSDIRLPIRRTSGAQVDFQGECAPRSLFGKLPGHLILDPSPAACGWRSGRTPPAWPRSCTAPATLGLRHPQSSGLPYCWKLSEMALKMKNKDLYKSWKIILIKSKIYISITPKRSRK